MAETKQEAKQRDKGLADRGVYTPPTLKEFGPVGALTQGGAGTVTEPDMGMGTGGNPMRRN